MRRLNYWLPVFIGLACVGFLAAALAAPQSTGAEEKLTNPLSPTPDILAAGAKVFAAHCSECHGDEGKGDGMMAEDMDPLPPDLTDGDWKHGSADGDLFTVIRDGTKDGMKKFGRKLTPDQIWQVVTFIRSIGPSQKSQ